MGNNYTATSLDAGFEGGFMVRCRILMTFSVSLRSRRQYGTWTVARIVCWWSSLLG